MNVFQLNKEQKTFLKRNLLAEIHQSVTYGELAVADELIPDELLFCIYANVEFVNSDFNVKEK
jgi:hypothetical protein